MRLARSVLREAVRSARGATVASLAVVVMIAGMCTTVLLTSGRTAGAQQQVLAALDSPAGRTVLVRAAPGSGLTSAVLDRLATVTGIEQAFALGPSTDVTNQALPAGERVSLRALYGGDPTVLGIPAHQGDPGAFAYASPLAQQRLAMAAPVGAVQDPGTGRTYSVVGALATADPLAAIEPVVVVPTADDGTAPVGVLVVLARTPELTTPVRDAVAAVLAVEDPATVQVTTSGSLTDLRTLVDRQLGAFGNGLVLVVLAITAALVTAVQVVLVMLRRRDFGRRRALGATRLMVVALVSTQVLVLSALGALLGDALGVALLRAGHDPVPGVGYVVAVGVVAVLAGVLGSVAPAVVASRRDPLHELRVP